ncbi:MAG: tyrosine-type recombinase/integrase, partial [candidate division Zixibacteria bacterium]|nr:tyrosine-type recombinase/integrase [candidate division Zixibacteria bacterium]
NPIVISKKRPGAIRPATSPKKKPVYFTMEQIALILKEVPKDLKSQTILFLNTGLRLSELINLRWEDVDLENRMLHLQPHGSYAPKNRELNIIPLNDTAYELLESLPKSGKYVFSDKSGERPQISDPSWFSTRYRKLFKGLGLYKKGVSVHTLRHTFASQLAMSGVGLYDIKTLMRHSSIRTTEIYAHLTDKHVREQVQKISITG